MKRRVCFFVNTKDPEVLKNVNFYSQDIQILKDLNYEVKIVNNPLKLITTKCEFYYVWWWTYAVFPLILSKFKKVPLIITGTFNIDNPHNNYYNRSFFQRVLINISLRNAHANIFVSEYEYNRMCDEFSYTNFHYSPHIVDSKYQELDEPILPKEKFLLSISWLQKSNFKRKCIDQAIRAMALIKDELRDYKYIIAGRYGEGADELFSLVEELDIGDLVEFKGNISEEEKIQLMKKCSIFVSPTYYEGFGLAMVEAMSCGSPILTTKVSAVPYVLGDIPFYIMDNTPETIANAILKFLSDSSLRKRTLAGITRSKELYNYSVRKRDIEKIINTLIN